MKEVEEGSSMRPRECPMTLEETAEVRVMQPYCLDNSLRERQDCGMFLNDSGWI